MGKWAELAKGIKRRDDTHVEELNSRNVGGVTTENLADLANGRAADALAVLIEILEYLDEQDTAKEESKG